MGNGENFFTERIAQLWQRLPRVMVESPSLKGFNTCVDVALGSLVGLDDLRGLSQPY